MLLFAEIVIAFLLLAGAFFGIVGSVGLVKLPDPMTRLHAPTKAATLGVGAVLIASMLYSPIFLGHWSWHELLITLFITVTAPTTGHFIAKANMHLSIPPSDLPEAGRGEAWATYGDSDARSETDGDEALRL